MPCDWSQTFAVSMRRLTTWSVRDIDEKCYRSSKILTGILKKKNWAGFLIQVNNYNGPLFYRMKNMEFIQLKNVGCSGIISCPLVGLGLECGDVKCLRKVGYYLPTTTLLCSLTEDLSTSPSAPRLSVLTVCKSKTASTKAIDINWLSCFIQSLGFPVVFAHLGHKAAFVGSWLPMFWDNLSVPPSRIKKSNKNVWLCVASQKSEYLIYTAAET